jgi:hypothetical protein
LAAILPLGAATSRAQVQVYLPPPAAAAPAPGAAHLLDPAPVYRPTTYQSQPYQPPAYPAHVYSTQASGPVAVPHVASLPTYTASLQPAAPWPATQSQPVAMPTPIVTPSPAAPAPWSASRTPPTPPSGGSYYPSATLPGYAAGAAGGPAYAQSPSAYGAGPAGHYGSYGSCTSNSACCDNDCCCECDRWCDNMTVIADIGAFKSPVDLDGLNGNFGGRVGGYTGVPIVKSLGIGAQFGSTAGWYDWKGSLYTGEDYRFQHFITAGAFQRCECGLLYGGTYDWLRDDYYADFEFTQWRAVVGWELNPCNEIGVWAALPDRRDEAFVGTPAVLNRFSPVLQGNVYFRHVWNFGGTTTIFGGLCETPSDVSFGASSQVPLNDFVALTGSWEYILPGSGGTEGRQEELWNVSVGIAIYPGSAMSAVHSRFRPVLPMADNGNFGIYRE